MRQVYMDYSATTPVKQEVLETMSPYFTEHYGNPSSLYTIGQESKAAISNARRQVASIIGADEKEIYFTACGTESDNWAIFGTADAKKGKGKHIITSKIEHHAVLHSCQQLEKQGYDVTYLDVEPDGTINPQALKAALRADTVMVSIMMVNNEVGTIEPIKELCSVTKAFNKEIIFHTDAVQGLGNVSIDVKELGIDLMSMSAHKIYGPKGVGGFFIRKGLRITNYLHGGAQENRHRAGTENIAGIVGFGKAAELAEKNLDEHIRHCSELRDYFIEQVLKNIPNTEVNGNMEHRHPGNASITFNYIEGESILLLLDAKGIYVSTGSACSSTSLTPSHVLTALGVPVERIHGTVRFSIGDFTTKEDLDYVLDELKPVVTRLREISSISEKEGW